MSKLRVSAETFLQLSAFERARQVLMLSGRSEEQIDTMMERHTPFEVLVNNMMTCRGAHADKICAGMSARLLEELAKFPPRGHAPWTNLETRDLIAEVVRPLIEIPAGIRRYLAPLDTLQADPA